MTASPAIAVLLRYTLHSTARISRGMKGFLLSEENPVNIPMGIIEVRLETYLEESDSPRFEDRYGRA